ncbi:MAG: DUF4129 domain-containing protein [Armatimonadetes bacterium]|nr:DUF4129 domain-containing protein [Armatimonadota bacterium]
MLRRSFVCALIAAGLCVGLPLRGSAETLSQYDKMLTSASQSLDWALKQERSRAGSSEKTIDSLYESVPPEMRVSMPNGEVVKADFAPIRNSLREINYSNGNDRISKIETLSKQVQAIKDAIGGKSSNISVDREKAANLLKNELADARYKTSTIENWLQKLLDARDDLLERMMVAPVVASAIGWVLLGVIVIAFVAVLVFLALRLLAYYSVKAPKRERAGQQQIVRRSAPSLKSILETSQKQASEGRYREAYRNMYIATILTLDKAKLISYADGITNWEYLRALSRQSAPEATEVFRNMTSSFDELIYGERCVAAGDYETCVSKYKSLEEML